MSSKSISTGTLSLRFMQNAHRAKQLKEVELDRAEVKDDGMWEVSKAVRDAWALPRDSDSTLVLIFQYRVNLIFFADLRTSMNRHTYHSCFHRKVALKLTTAPPKLPLRG